MATDGQPMGCRDGGSPQFSTDEKLSRIHDALQALKAAGLEEAASAAWSAIPRAVRIDAVWAQWTYRASKS